MTLSPKGTTSRRILDLLYQKPMKMEDFARSLSDISRPALRNTIAAEIKAGRIADGELYELTQAARNAYQIELSQAGLAMKPLQAKHIASASGTRSGSNDMRQYPSKF
jgi:hypothetical protein